MAPAAHRRRQYATQPIADRPAKAIVPGSGTTVGVYVRSSPWPPPSKLQPNVPATGLTNPLVSNPVDASSAAASVGPL